MSTKTDNYIPVETEISELPIMLIWHEEKDLKIYWLENLRPADREGIVGCHGFYIGLNLDKEWEAWLSDFMGSIDGSERYSSDYSFVTLGASEPCRIVVCGRINDDE